MSVSVSMSTVPFRFLAVSLAVVLYAAAPAGAIVVNGDPDDYVVTAPSDYDMMAKTDAVGGAGGVLVDPWWVLTAGHVTDYGHARTFTVTTAAGSTTYDWAEVIRHPAADLAVVRLDGNTGLPGHELYTATDERFKTGILTGYGMSGTGTSVGAGGAPAYPRGTLRAGTNRIDATAPVGGTSMLRTDFDENGTDVMIGLGDSGGAVFIDDGGTLKVAGIHSFVDSGDDEMWPTWGDKGYSVRVSQYVGWINGAIPVAGDFNDDDLINIVDIDLLLDEIGVGGTTTWPYDLSADGMVNSADTVGLVEGIMGTFMGDANLDKTVNVFDLSALATNYRKVGDMGWSDGDFTGDGFVDIFDLAILASRYGNDAAGGGTPVPEPGVMLLLAAGGLTLIRRRKLSVQPRFVYSISSSVAAGASIRNASSMALARRRADSNRSVCPLPSASGVRSATRPSTRISQLAISARCPSWNRVRAISSGSGIRKS